MLWSFLLYSKVNQLCVYIYPLFFLYFLPIWVTTEQRVDFLVLYSSRLSIGAILF